MISQLLERWAVRKMVSRAPDLTIGDEKNPYLRRWWIIPRNRLFNVYLHEILRSDDDRALHDHPWWNFTYIIRGGYCEHTIDAGGIHRRTWRWRGAWKFRAAGAAHRLEMPQDGWKPTLTLFVTGPRLRQWGFHCPDAGWRHWKDFTDGANGERVGRGCGE